jgi:uncharacterized protein YbjQ (UPF0145 family)
MKADHPGTPLEPDRISSRLERLRNSRSWGHPGPVNEFAATASAGFDPVGQVFGTMVLHLGAVAGGGRCSAGKAGYALRTDLASAGGPLNTLRRRLYGARRLALERAVTECEALGGDGIVGISMTARRFHEESMEFTVEGTAVRARSRTRPVTPFTTHVSGQDYARLLSSGWMPFALVFGLAIGTRHFDQKMREQTRWRRGIGGNIEVAGYTHLVNDTRRDARRELEAAVLARGGHGVVVQDMTLHVSKHECPSVEHQHDFAAEAFLLGTAIFPIALSPRAPEHAPLAIMRLDPRTATAATPEPEPVIPEPSLTDRFVTYWSARRRARDAFNANNVG